MGTCICIRINMDNKIGLLSVSKQTRRGRMTVKVLLIET